MKRILALTLILGFMGCSEMVDPPKYEYGDCITPTDPTYTWYGEYAKVEAFVVEGIKGYQSNAYVLNFPNYLTTRNLFIKEIESDTKKVDYLENCGLPR